MYLPGQAKSLALDGVDPKAEFEQNRWIRTNPARPTSNLLYFDEK
jgi:hypothetical protein